MFKKGGNSEIDAKIKDQIAYNKEEKIDRKFIGDIDSPATPPTRFHLTQSVGTGKCQNQVNQWKNSTNTRPRQSPEEAVSEVCRQHVQLMRSKPPKCIYPFSML